MGEGEMLTYAGAPDLLFADVFSDRTYIYLPTVADPFTTTVVIIGGRISGIERVRKF
jgi:predicted unusual protein kinase regulating ubiquinone biosynthesis (AarF/ABC1/UbiB family)